MFKGFRSSTVSAHSRFLSSMFSQSGRLLKSLDVISFMRPLRYLNLVDSKGDISVKL